MWDSVYVYPTLVDPIHLPPSSDNARPHRSSRLHQIISFPFVLIWKHNEETPELDQTPTTRLILGKDALDH